MSTHLASVRVGRAVVRVSAEGCVGCGTLWAPSWHAAESIEVTIGKRRQTLNLYRCDRCSIKQPRPAETAPARERAGGERAGKPTLPDGADGKEFGG